MGNFNSGRRAGVDERLRNAVINKCWEILDAYLKSSQAKEDRKLDIAKQLCTKSIPTQLQGDSENPLHFVPIYAGEARKSVDSNSDGQEVQVSGHDGDTKDISASEENQGG